METETVPIEKLLEQEYRRTLEGLVNATSETDTATWELKKLSELGKQYQLISQTNAEVASKKEETVLKTKQAKESRFEKWATVIINSAAVLVPAVLSSYWMGKGLHFEETGAFTSKTGNWISGITRLFRK